MIEKITVVLLSPSPQSKEEEGRLKKIIELCEESGHKVLQGYNTAKTKKQINYKYVSTKIKDSDAVIIEGTRATLDTGRFIASALQYHKPILILHKDKLPDILADDTHKLVSIKQYDENKTDKLQKDVIEDFFLKVHRKKLLYRFNLMLNKEMNAYLMDKAKTNSISKADYIRQLIEADMK
jgi:hypothetical protein